MEKIINYEGFSIKFKISDEIYLNEETCLALNKSMKNKHFWFEVILFELIDTNNDGIPDKKFGRKFTIEFGKPLKNKGVEESDYPKIKKTSEEEISRGSAMIGGLLFPNIIYRQKEI